jgi:hypothetical protein
MAVLATHIGLVMDVVQMAATYVRNDMGLHVVTEGAGPGICSSVVVKR